ncbi:acyl-CoA dehydrogenase family protein [Crossiella equi]|nr:acyl-CoA dehydrogenase family protein [Crossiella equi]
MELTKPLVRPDLVGRARALVPLLREKAPISDINSSPLPEIVSALAAAGMFRLEVPKDLGGFQASLRTEMAVCAEIGRGCPSMAWLVGLNACAARLLLSRFALLRGELAERPDTLFCSLVAPKATAARVPGGWRVSGKGGFAAGCEMADRIALWGVPVSGEDSRRVSLLVRGSEVDIERTWDFAGMRGTGSHTVVVSDVFVPDDAAAPAAVDPVHGGYTNLPLPQQVLGAVANALPTFVGAAHGALDLVTAALANGRGLADTTYRRALDAPSARHWLAEATHLVHSAYQHLWFVADELDHDPGHKPMELSRRVAVRMHMSSVVSLSRKAMEKILDLGGAAAFAVDNPLQRYWRDLEAGSRHARLNPFVAVEDYGRFLGNEDTPVATMI